MPSDAGRDERAMPSPSGRSCAPRSSPRCWSRRPAGARPTAGRCATPRPSRPRPPRPHRRGGRRLGVRRGRVVDHRGRRDRPAAGAPSSAIPDGGEIPARYTCRGEDVSPPLLWTGVPSGTVELAVVVRDVDAEGFVHWVVAGLPPISVAWPTRPCRPRRCRRPTTSDGPAGPARARPRAPTSTSSGSTRSVSRRVSWPASPAPTPRPGWRRLPRRGRPILSARATAG